MAANAENEVPIDLVSSLLDSYLNPQHPRRCPLLPAWLVPDLQSPEAPAAAPRVRGPELPPHPAPPTAAAGGPARSVRADAAQRHQDHHQQDMDISSSHDTTPTSDESHPRQLHLHHQQLHHRDHHRDDYYDNSQDKTPPSSLHHHQLQNDKQGTPSPVGGPPTPTQNENSSHRSLGGIESNSVVNNLVSSSAVGNLVSSSPLIALKPQIPVLTPSLGRFYKESLIGHVTNWPAEAVERSCQRINEEHLNISNLGITKVSTELKMARSLVRLAEIQATLQEQRILFLRQQSIDLESMRPRVAYLHSINSSSSTGEPHHHHTIPNAQSDQQGSPSVAANSTPTVVSSNA